MSQPRPVTFWSELPATLTFLACLVLWGGFAFLIAP